MKVDYNEHKIHTIKKACGDFIAGKQNLIPSHVEYLQLETDANRNKILFKMQQS